MSAEETQRRAALAAICNQIGRNSPIHVGEIACRLFQGPAPVVGILSKKQKQGELEGCTDGEANANDAKSIGKRRNPPRVREGSNRKYQNIEDSPPPKHRKGGSEKENPKGGAFCWRCNISDHFARKCHMPFQPAIAFRRTGKWPSETGNKGRPIILAAAISMCNHEVQSPEHPCDVGL